MASRRQCKRALQIHEEKLCHLNHVVGLGVVPLEDDQKPVRDHAVAVYVRRPTRSRKDRGRIPSILRIPGRKGEVEVPTRIIEQGEVTLESEEFGFE